MAFDRATIQFLLNAKSLGIPLDRILTIGRQVLYVKPDDLASLLSANGISSTERDAQELLQQEQGYCEPFLRRIGAGEIDSMDVSSYENATILHDMNQPLPEQYHNRYSLVVDGGSLEHVFNYPTALANCMRAVRLGGCVLIITPANNMLGHGFYQISPELLFRVLGPSNGYRLIHMILYEQPWNGTWYQVMDPENTKSRVELLNHRPTLVIACAKRTAIVPLFAETPQQSDYARIWQESDDPNRRRFKLPRQWKHSLPAWITDLYGQLRPFRRRYYRRLPSQLPPSDHIR